MRLNLKRFIIQYSPYRKGLKKTLPSLYKVPIKYLTIISLTYLHICFPSSPEEIYVIFLLSLCFGPFLRFWWLWSNLFRNANFKGKVLINLFYTVTMRTLTALNFFFHLVPNIIKAFNSWLKISSFIHCLLKRSILFFLQTFKSHQMKFIMLSVSVPRFV